MSEDLVNHPPHYKGKRFESIDIIEDFELGFNLGNAIKYILRSERKGHKLQDLKKVIWYLEREASKVYLDQEILPLVPPPLPSALIHPDTNYRSQS